MKRVLRSFGGDQAGSVLVEAAIVFPVLVTLGFVTFEFSNIFFQHQAVTAGVRDAARYLARVSTTTTDPTADTINWPTYKTNAQNLAVYGVISGGTTPRVAGWKLSDVVISTPSIANPIIPATGSPTYRGTDPLYIMQVTSSFTYQQMGILTAFGFTDPTIAVSHSERRIGG